MRYLYFMAQFIYAIKKIDTLIASRTIWEVNYTICFEK